MRDEQQAIEQAVAQFPDTFGLRAFPGSTFRIGKYQSYCVTRWDSEKEETVIDRVMLYTQVLNKDGEWRDFAKGTILELRNTVTKDPNNA